MTASPVPRYRLQRTPASATAVDPDPDQEQLIFNTDRRLRVLAGPGTGKTSSLVEAVARRVADGSARPGQLLVLTYSRRAAAELSRRIAVRLGMATRDPIVRTLHSYAYSLVRRRAVEAGEPPPRLLAAGESDQMVRDLLAGHVATGLGGWPESLRPALGSAGFAAELRDLLLRAAEQGLTPRRIAQLGRREHRPEWIAVGNFAQEYQDVADLRQASTGLGPALDQAELTAAALAVLSDEQTLAREQTRIRRIFVDEYQDVDPAQAALVELLAAGADELLVAGDPDQSIYGFRGSQASALRDIQVDRTVILHRSRRLSDELVAASRRVAALLPGEGAHRDLQAEPDPDPAETVEAVSVVVLSSRARQAAYIADQLRREHLLRGVPWHRMAVLVRSRSLSG